MKTEFGLVRCSKADLFRAGASSLFELFPQTVRLASGRPVCQNSPQTKVSISKIWLVALTAMMIAAVPARALTDNETGTNGAPGNPGSDGGPATASAVSTDQNNSATATGGVGGPGNVAGAAGGNGGKATATAGTIGAPLNAVVTAVANGGAGGQGNGATGGAGGDALSTASGSTSGGPATRSVLTASATGGTGGSADGTGHTAGNGGSAIAIVDGTATAGGSLIGSSTAAGGPSGQAFNAAAAGIPGIASAATTLNTTGNASATASASGTSRVTNASGSSSIAANGPGKASASAGLGSEPLGSSQAQGLNSAAFAVTLPTVADATAAIAGHPNNESNFAFGTPDSTALGLFTLGVATNGSGVTTNTWTDTARIFLNPSSLPDQDLKLGLIDASTSGSGTLTLAFTLTNNSTGAPILTQSFTDLASAQAFFSDQVHDFGTLDSFTSTNGTKLDLTFSLSLTGATNASLVTDFVLGVSDIPEPSPTAMLTCGLVLLIVVRRFRRLVTLHRHQVRPLSGASELLSTAPSSASCAWAMALRAGLRLRQC